MLCDTYLFRVGLLGVLFSHFRLVLLLHPIYLLSTIFTDGYRVVSAYLVSSLPYDQQPQSNGIRNESLLYFLLHPSRDT